MICAGERRYVSRRCCHAQAGVLRGTHIVLNSPSRRQAVHQHRSFCELTCVGKQRHVEAQLPRRLARHVHDLQSGDTTAQTVRQGTVEQATVRGSYTACKRTSWARMGFSSSASAVNACAAGRPANETRTSPSTFTTGAAVGEVRHGRWLEIAR